MNDTIDNIQLPFFSLNANAIANTQCEWNLNSAQFSWISPFSHNSHFQALVLLKMDLPTIKIYIPSFIENSFSK